VAKYAHIPLEIGKANWLQSHSRIACGPATLPHAYGSRISASNKPLASGVGHVCGRSRGRRQIGRG